MRASPAQPRDEARRLSRHLAALEEGPMRMRAAARALADMPAALAARVVAELVDDAASGDWSAVAAVGQALVTEDALPYEARAALYAAAAELGLLEVQVLLVAPRGRDGCEEPRERPDPLVDSASLGHRKARARAARDPDVIARVAADGEPAVVRELLRNPKLTEGAVVRIAARRPCRPETLRCVWEDRRWRVRPPVLAALAKNPFLEPVIALQLLPALDGRALREIADDAALGLAVRALARRLCVLRRPGG